MNFILKPSLEHIAIVQVTATLFNQHDVRDLIIKFPYSKYFSQSDMFLYPHCQCKKGKEWKKIEDRVRKKIQELMIPTSLKEKLLDFIQPVSLQILNWMDYHFSCSKFDLCLPNEFCWTPQGTIDKKRTAEVLIKDEAIDIATRYKLACTYCLEENIPELWYKLPESQKVSFYNEENIDKIFQKELLIFWGQYIREKEVSRDNMVRQSIPISFSDKYLLQCAAENGNKTAAEYFLKKQNQREHSLDKDLLNAAIYVAKKHRILLGSITHPPGGYYSEVFCFLIAQINDEQQILVFKEYPLQALSCLLEWPWQNFFEEIANRMVSFLSDSYIDVFRMIIGKVTNGYKDYNYQKLFQDVWQQMPHTQKRYFITTDNFLFELLNLLLLIKDKENIKFIFQDLTLAEKKEFIFSDMGQIRCSEMIHSEEWNLLKFFVQLCISSKDDMIKLKEEYKNFFQILEMATRTLPKAIFEREKEKQEEFFQLLDNFIHSYDKRKSLDDGNSNPTGKLSNLKLKEQCEQKRS